MNNNSEINQFNAEIYNKYTKNICLSSTISIILILIFILSPLKKIFLISYFCKFIIILICIYIFCESIRQISMLKNLDSSLHSNEMNLHINSNLFCSYLFIIFIGLLIINLIKY
jgi:hypothetical protein